ncbi:MAG: hypothetical protein HON76_13560 [Candidatus Scalindua sp.]|jgi:hypothetical protein|nr:hypothetical protein [Candidatus Scalindua sp.]MBT5305476.1 hypothetical protein [Candidatus Scalindua sp.]MBT6045256.1 hypothetical protein [Candidatus Scalindua sp.]MBT6226482.1 hypothetical protein [Candidatus Scalindua sp.]MBT6563544.1 hypothetical protein [Candidatus Scalindua sp.]
MNEYQVGKDVAGLQARVALLEKKLFGSGGCDSLGNNEFFETAKAIDGIKDERLKRDFSDLFLGIEHGIKNNNYEVANDCIAALRTLAHSLCRTIGGSSAVAVIEGLANDAERAESKMLRAPIWSKGKRCDVGGTATCISATNNKCNSDSTGCISTGTGIAAGYIWGVTLLAHQ